MQPLLQWKISKYYMCIFSYRYPTCSSYAPSWHVACLAVRYCSTFSHKRHNFLKKKLLKMKYIFWFSPQLLFETFLNMRRFDQDMIKNVYLSSCEVPVLLIRFKWNLNFLHRFSKKCSNVNFHENPSSGSRVVPCGQTDVTKQTVAFHNFVNMPKIKQNKKWPTKLCKYYAFSWNLRNG